MRKQNKYILRNLADIKSFLLFLLNTVRYPIDLTTLNRIITDNISDITFDYESCLGELSDAGYLLFDEVDGEQYYMISDSGRLISSELYEMLPEGLREQSERCAAKYVSLSKTGAEVSTKIEETEDKRFRVSFSAKEAGREIMSVSLVVSSRSQAEQMAQHFEERPDSFYRGVLFSATGKLEFLT